MAATLSRAIHLHRVTWGVILFLFLLFTLLNFIQDAYVERLESGWHGGLRMGYPAYWWDAGHRSTLAPGGKLADLKLEPYGGLQLRGALINLAIFLAVTLVVGWLTELLLRKIARPKPQSLSPQRQRAAHAITSVIALLVIVVFIALNLQIRTTAGGNSADPDYRQKMGFPLLIYEGHEPVLAQMNEEFQGEPTVREVLAWLDAHPGARYARTHWHFMNIVLNILLALSLVFIAALCSERWMKSKEMHTR